MPACHAPDAYHIAYLRQGDSPQVFVVLGAYGAYEDRMEFLCGVFATRKEAVEAISAATARSNTYREWHKKICALRAERNYPNVEDMPEYNAPDRPPHEAGEEFAVIAVEPGIWHSSLFGDF